jgi:hypothetical protein
MTKPSFHPSAGSVPRQAKHNACRRPAPNAIDSGHQDRGAEPIARHAANRGVALTAGSIGCLTRQLGERKTAIYIDNIGKIMDAASMLGMECSQARATRRLSRAGGDVEQVIAEFAAEHRRRADRRNAPCRVPVPPHALTDRPNAFAGCGCPHCCERLASHMERYINKMIAARFFSGLDREEARGEAYLELVRSIDTWPGGNFTGWFSVRFTNRVKEIYRSRSNLERETMSLDTDMVPSHDNARTVPLAERIPDRTVDVLTIVLLRERIFWPILQLRRACAARAGEFERASLPRQTAPSRIRGDSHNGRSRKSSRDIRCWSDC